MHSLSLSTVAGQTLRVETARRRFFEEGQSPAGAVAPAVFESWSRSLRIHGNPSQSASFEPVTRSRTQLALMKNRQLIQAWSDELPRLESVLSSTSCGAMLTDATGVLIAASCIGRPHEQIMPVATRLGVNLSEEAVGTTAPGIAARIGKPVSVIGAEHFFESITAMHCAAAPIRDLRGELMGVLDISSELMPFSFDASAVVGLYASAIESRLLVAQSNEHLVIRFQAAPELLDSAMAALIGIDASGKVAWENGVARRLFGRPPWAHPQAHEEPEELLGMAWSALADLPNGGAAPLTLPNGLTVWARAEMRAPDGRRVLLGQTGLQAARRADAVNESLESAQDRGTAAPGPAARELADSEAAAVQSSASRPTQKLRDSDLNLIRETLEACDGNVSVAAQRLGVSRGLIYRRLNLTRSKRA